jgi:hypothetical protein
MITNKQTAIAPIRPITAAILYIHRFSTTTYAYHDSGGDDGL